MSFKLKSYILFFVFIGCELTSCSKHEDLDTITFPSSLEVLVGEDIFRETQEARIVHYIDFGCSDCFSELSDWKTFISEYNLKDRDVIFIIKTDDSKFSEYIIKERIGLSNTFIWDRKDDFFSENIKSYDKSLYTFLLNKKNKILKRGNPINSSSLRNRYAEIINGT